MRICIRLVVSTDLKLNGWKCSLVKSKPKKRHNLNFNNAKINKDYNSIKKIGSVINY